MFLNKKSNPQKSRFILSIFFEAIDFYVMRFGLDLGKAHLSVVPNGSLEDFWPGLEHFDYSPAGKNGCGGFSKSFAHHIS